MWDLVVKLFFQEISKELQIVKGLNAFISVVLASSSKNFSFKINAQRLSNVLITL